MIVYKNEKGVVYLSMMQIDYRRIKLTLFFEKKISINIPFAYVFRSVLGNELHYLSCVLKKQVCGECPLRFKCAYSVLFENPVSKDNEVIKGRDKAPSPYIIQAEYYNNTEIEKVDLTVIFTGTGIDYISYFLLAVKRAGENGMFRERIKYTMGYISYSSKEYSMDYDFASLPVESYIYDTNEDKVNKNIKISFITPFRYKKMGKYTSDININDILLAALRRVNMLSSFYGIGDTVSYNGNISNAEESHNFSWLEGSRYSRRQDVSMKIGGISGSMNVKADFTMQQLSLLNAAVLFNIGKNVSFGLGHIKYEDI